MVRDVLYVVRSKRIGNIRMYIINFFWSIYVVMKVVEVKCFVLCLIFNVFVY